MLPTRRDFLLAAASDELLAAEGISQVDYVVSDSGPLLSEAIAAKRVVRAIDLCLSAPTRVARQVVDRGFTPNYDYAVQTLSDVPYGKWRDYDPEDTIRFYALRLHEARMIKSSPDRIIADGADWRFLREVRRELG